MNILLIFICILACIPLVLTQYPAQFEPVPCKNECRSEGGDVGRCCHLYGYAPIGICIIGSSYCRRY
ncbi:hypothetical protein PRIPAC_70231 [Pristionchus pacificus]|uniref:Uncharacterized protein n=1 Tax=Pristionchus pacificus TaxID=54126 RepID=A0A2A6CA49_PRIPA|nr:hypothetical protein PRIPAC_70231 [Pristionchus pacificus]|eukprot:PDM75019.1 hypothetical protein PRIPAC_40400 [Pristionchus pacificus]